MVSIVSMCSPHIENLMENYVNILNTIHERNVQSVHCKKRVRWSNSMGELACPSLVFIEFYVPALTPGLH
jgi:hypothetical protein